MLDNAVVFKNMAAQGTTALKGLTDALQRSVGDQKQKISGLTTSLERLGAAYDALGGKGARAAAISAKMVQVQANILGRKGELGQLETMAHRDDVVSPGA